MSNTVLITQLTEKLHEVYSVQPNDLGVQSLTRLYKLVTSRLKTVPFVYLVPLSFVLTVGVYLFVGALLVKLVSLLQYGF